MDFKVVGVASVAALVLGVIGYSVIKTKRSIKASTNPSWLEFLNSWDPKYSVFVLKKQDSSKNFAKIERNRTEERLKSKI